MIFMVMLKKYWREALILVLIAACYFEYSLPKPEPVTITKEQIVYKDRVVTVVKEVEAHKSRTKTVTKPDGTKIVTESHEDRASDTKTADTTHEQQVNTTTESANTQYDYSIQITIKPQDPRAVKLDIGARIGRLPVSGVVGYDFEHKEAQVGLRYEF